MSAHTSNSMNGSETSISSGSPSNGSISPSQGSAKPTMSTRALHRQPAFTLPNRIEARYPWNDGELLEMYKTELGIRLLRLGYPDIHKSHYLILKFYIEKLERACIETTNQGYSQVNASRGLLEEELKHFGLEALASKFSQDAVLEAVLNSETMRMNAFRTSGHNYTY